MKYIFLYQRGRLYCSPGFLNYQSTELSKALLLFAKHGTIVKTNYQAIMYLKAYVANCFGGTISKQSIQSKQKWIDDHIDDIINIENGVLLEKATDKLLFLAFCIEFKRFYKFYTDENSLCFETYLPIQLDATCNGFQHMALLSNEVRLFKELNLVQLDKLGKDSIPNDFYSFLLHKVIKLWTEKVNEMDSPLDSKTSGYERLLNFVWNRANFKKAIMTMPYNSASGSQVDYLVEDLYSFDYDPETKTQWYSVSPENTEPRNSNKDAYLAVSSVKYIIDSDFERIRKLSKYLSNVAKLFNILELPITWRLPTGLTIIQSHMHKVTTSITPFTFSKTRINLKTTVLDKFDYNKQVRSLMPNLIHSLDATSMYLLYKTFYKSYPDCQFFSIHDCFGTTMDKVSTLKIMLASVYTDLY